MQMRTVLLIAMLSVDATAAVQQTHDALEHAEALEHTRQPQALAAYEAVLTTEPENHRALCKASLLSAMIGNRASSPVEKDRLFLKARAYAERALKVNPDDAESHFVMAVALGRAAEQAPPIERVRAAIAVRNHIDTALRIDPRHAGAWYVLGRLRYRAANASPVEKMAARVVLGGERGGFTNRDAIDAFERAVALRPYQTIYYEDLARAHLANGDRTRAILVLHKAVRTRSDETDDRISRARCQALLAGLTRD